MNITMNMSSMGKMQGMQGGGKPPKAADLIKFMDQDGNGSLSKDEVKGPLADQFKTADANSDNQLSADELQKAMDSMHQQMKGKMGGMGNGQFQPPSAVDLIKSMDKDSNGSISKSEAKGVVAKHFDDADTNKDGVVSQKELEADMAKNLPPSNTTDSSSANKSNTFKLMSYSNMMKSSNSGNDSSASSFMNRMIA
ncbi:MAG: EF-hand domain-containing protein [Magnetococcales bacterium]|nr:EF-hand domain-containing protein [Magnetococcales bacterium]